jgi:hypothetical protein
LCGGVGLGFSENIFFFKGKNCHLAVFGLFCFFATKISIFFLVSKRSLMMLQKIRKLLCIHSFEYEIGHNIVVKECRKCGAHH